MKFMTIVAFACVISAGLVAGNQWREMKRIEADLISRNTHEKIDPERCQPLGHFVYQSGIIECDLKPIEWPAQPKRCEDATPADQIGANGYWKPSFCLETRPMSDEEWVRVQREIIETYKIEPELARKWLAIPRAKPPAVGEE